MKYDDPVDRVAEIFLIAVVLLILYLKIINVIKLSWLWLLSPLWGGLLIGIIILIAIIIAGTVEILLDKKEKKDERY